MEQKGLQTTRVNYAGLAVAVTGVLKGYGESETLRLWFDVHEIGRGNL